MMVRVKPEAITELKGFASKADCAPNTYAAEIIECYIAEKKTNQRVLAGQMENIITRSTTKQLDPGDTEPPE